MSESVITLTDAEISALESSTSPAHSPQHLEETDTIVFRNCKTGLGIKIVGGTSEDFGDSDFGIFVKRVIPGGLAAESGRLYEGDQILSVNSESLYKVSNERAVQLLRNASASNHVTLVIARGPQTLRKFRLLIENQLARRGGGGSTSNSQTEASTTSSAHRISFPGMSSRGGSQGSSPTSSVESYASDNERKRRNVFQIVVSKVAGLGLHLSGGSDRPEGPGIFIDRVIEGGDCYTDGRVRAGDQLVAINDHSLVGLPLNEAKAIITRISLRPDLNSVTLSYIPGIRTPLDKDRMRTPSSHPSGASQTFSSPQMSPQPYSLHSSPQLGGTAHSNPQMGGNRITPVSQSNMLQQSLTGINSEESSTMGREVLPERRSPAIGQSARTPPGNSEMNPFMQGPGSSPHKVPLSALPLHLQQAASMEPKMTSTPEGVNGMPSRQSIVPPPPGGDPSPVLPPYNAPHYNTQPLHYTQYPSSPTHSPTPHPNNIHPTQHYSHHHSPNHSPTPHLKNVHPSHYSHHSSPNHSPTPHHPRNMTHSQFSSPAPSPSPTPRPDSKRLTIDPQIRLKIDKLQVALEYLGIHPTPAQNQELLTRLSIDRDGMVPYGDFVVLARQLFKMQLDESNMSGSVTNGGYDVTDFAEPPPFQPKVLTPPPVLPPPSVVTHVPIAEYENLRRERDQARSEVEQLRHIAMEKDRSFSEVEDELLRLRKQAQSAIEESRALKSRVHLAEVAQQEARNMELDYEEVVVMLEDELNKLRKKIKKRSPPLPQPPPQQFMSDGPMMRELQTRLAVLGCELRKAEATKRTYEVATEKLLHFAEMVHENLTDNPTATMSSRNRGENARRGANGFKPPGYLAMHKGPVNIATEAKDTVRAVKTIIEAEGLPYGWEETYTADGTKYFMNHITHCTTWIHPSSRVDHQKHANMADRDDLQESRT